MVGTVGVVAYLGPCLDSALQGRTTALHLDWGVAEVAVGTY